ncbi:MaoC family dehydratase [Streptomyces echinatus]|uniref:MaoC family dehydratase n=1 Tax=Streptomyces echinatus TaxID=67293 RepID=UPI0037A87104
MKIFSTPAELAAYAGGHVGTSQWHTLDQKHIDLFAEATGDHQWIHTDPERAADGPYGATIAHGYLTLSLVASLTGQAYYVDGTRMIINYGLNKVRFPSAVTSGSQIRASVDFVTVEEITGGYQLVSAVTVEVFGSDKPACVAETVLRFYL